MSLVYRFVVTIFYSIFNSVIGFPFYVSMVDLCTLTIEEKKKLSHGCKTVDITT